MEMNEGLRPMGQASAGAVVKDGGQSSLYAGKFTSSCVKNQTIKEVAMENDEPLVKGGCGRSAEELMFSAKVCAVLTVLMLAGIGVAVLFA